MCVFQGGGGTLTLEGSAWLEVTYPIQTGRDLTIRSGVQSFRASLLVHVCRMSCMLVLSWLTRTCACMHALTLRHLLFCLVRACPNIRPCTGNGDTRDYCTYGIAQTFPL